MKRFNNLYEKIYSIENLRLADSKARKGKSQQYGIKIHDRNRENNIIRLHEMLKDKTYRTSPYTTFKIYEPKEREVFRLPYYPDRITHHAVMNILEPIFVSTFTADTYSCIKGRGIHSMSTAIKEALKNVERTKYCLKLDIQKFYPSVNHEILKKLLRRKFKDKDLLWLLDEIVDSTAGLPIGNYLSQPFSNFYMTYFDHWIKETMQVIDYFRYCDDMVFFSNSKEYLHKLLFEIRKYLWNELNLKIKGNYQVFLVSSRGVNVVGYNHFHTHTLLRKSIKKDFARMLHYRKNPASVASYMGWVNPCDSKHLIKKLLPKQTIN